MDDGSADDAAADVVRACDDPRATYIRLPVSRGPAAARNAGLANVRAPYVAFLDDDDEWLPQKLQIQLGRLEHAGPSIGVIYTARITVDQLSGAETITRFPSVFDRTNGVNIITTSSVLMRRRCFERIGVFDEELFVAEDFDLWIRVAASFGFHYVDKALVKYFVHTDGISHHDSTSPWSSDVRQRNARSLERLLAKHRELFDTNRRGHGRSYLALARKYRQAGDVINERRALRQSLRLWPFEPRIYSPLIRASLSRNPDRMPTRRPDSADASEIVRR